MVSCQSCSESDMMSDMSVFRAFYENYSLECLVPLLVWLIYEDTCMATVLPWSLVHQKLVD